jgi:hypothetical protein
LLEKKIQVEQELPASRAPLSCKRQALSGYGVQSYHHVNEYHKQLSPQNVTRKNSVTLKVMNPTRPALSFAIPEDETVYLVATGIFENQV